VDLKGIVVILYVIDILCFIIIIDNWGIGKLMCRKLVLLTDLPSIVRLQVSHVQKKSFIFNTDPSSLSCNFLLRFFLFHQ
jgi:hypothetical protein